MFPNVCYFFLVLKRWKTKGKGIPGGKEGIPNPSPSRVEHARAWIPFPMFPFPFERLPRTLSFLCCHLRVSFVPQNHKTKRNKSKYTKRQFCSNSQSSAELRAKKQKGKKGEKKCTTRAGIEPWIKQMTDDSVRS